MPFTAEQFGLLAEKTLHFLIIMTKKGKIIDFNDRCDVLFSNSKTNTDIKYIQDFIVNEDILELDKVISSLHQKKSILTTRLSFISEKGRDLSIKFNFSLQDDLIYAAGVDATIEDKTYDKKWLQVIINNGMDYTLLLNTKGEVLLADDNSIKMAKRDFNVDPSKTKCSFIDIIPLNFRSIFAYSFNETLKGKTIQKEFERITHKGSSQWLDTKYIPIFDDNQKVESVLITFNDITEEKLAALIVEQAQLKEQELQDLKSNILSNLSHEIRTPLNGIMTISSLLQIEESQKERDKLIGYLKESQDRLLETLTTLTGFSEIENLQKNLNYKRVDINYMVETSFREYRHRAKAKNLDYTLDLEESIPEVIIDEIIFKTALDNIIHNAIKYTDIGSVNVKIKRSKKNIYIYVIDTGIGIDKKNFKKIFDPFVQESIGLNRKYEGTGIGLSLSKRYIEILGGRIKVKSKLGKGTEFKIIISDSV